MKLDFHFGAHKSLFESAKEMRSNPTEAEKALWERLRKKRTNGYKFRRQHPVKDFILDFYCHELSLGIEVDGEIHNQPGQKEYDENRTYELNELDIKIIRFTNEQVLE